MAPKSVLITGCSAGGIGYALAEEFQTRGLHVFATARTRSKPTNLENLPNVTFIPLDITNPFMISAAVGIVSVHTGGTLDYLVNNAGYLYVMPTLDVDIDDAKKLFDVNLWGALAVSQAFAPLVIAAKGTVVNISSISSHIYVPWLSELGLASQLSLPFSFPFSSNASSSFALPSYPIETAKYSRYLLSVQSSPQRG